MAGMLALVVVLLLLMYLGMNPVRAQQACENIGTDCPVDMPDNCGNDNSCCSMDRETCCDPSQQGETCDNQSEICCPCAGPAVFPANDNTALIALTDLNDNTYRYDGTYPLGLYVDNVSSPTVQTNDITDAGISGHYQAGLAQGAYIVPRATGGAIDLLNDNSSVGFVSVGFSDVEQEWGDFIEDKIQGLSSPFDGLNEKLVFVNGGRDNHAACEWEETPDLEIPTNIWANLVAKLGSGKAPGDGSTNTTGIDRFQVQAVWMKMVIDHPWNYCKNVGSICDCAQNLCNDNANDNTGCRFPNWVFGTDGEVEKLEKILQNIREVFPNVGIVFLSNRIYGGYANEVDGAVESVPPPCRSGSPEPWAYENGFTIQALVRKQAFEGGLAYGSTDLYAYIVWGPPLWSNGTRANPEGLTWECHEICADGTHPSCDDSADPLQSGQTQVAEILYSFFKTHPLATDWYLEHPTIVTSDPPDGFVDPLEDLDGESPYPAQGITEITIQFDKAVRDKNNEGSLDKDSFQITSTGSNPPTVESVSNPSGNTYVLTLNGPIEPGEWTTIIALVEDSDDNLIRLDPWDRIDIGFLPGDVNDDGVSNASDVDAIQACLASTSCMSDPPLDRMDIDRDGALRTADKTRLVDVLRGINSTQEWQAYESFPAKP